MKKLGISQVSHYERARVDDPQNVSKKRSKSRSKMRQKSIKSQCWKPSKSVFRYLGRFDASQIDFLTIFIHFSPKMPSEMDLQINQNRSRGPALNVGLTFLDFCQILEEFCHDFGYIEFWKDF